MNNKSIEDEIFEKLTSTYGTDKGIQKYGSFISNFYGKHEKLPIPEFIALKKITFTNYIKNL